MTRATKSLKEIYQKYQRSELGRQRDQRQNERRRNKTKFKRVINQLESLVDLFLEIGNRPIKPWGVKFISLGRDD